MITRMRLVCILSFFFFGLNYCFRDLFVRRNLGVEFVSAKSSVIGVSGDNLIQDVNS